MSKERWSDCGQVYYCEGWAWGITVRGVTICLGKEEDIEKFFQTGELNPKLEPLHRQTLMQIQEYRQEEGFGISANITGAEDMERSQYNGASGRNQRATRRATLRERVSLRSIKSKSQSLSGRRSP